MSNQVPEGWSFVNVGSVCHTIYRYPTFYGMELLEQGVPVIRGEHIDDLGVLSKCWSDYYFVSQEVSCKYPKTMLHTGDVVMAVRGTVGKFAKVDLAHEKAQISPNLLRLAPDRHKISPTFFFQCLFPVKDSLLRDCVSATGVPALNAKDIANAQILLPPLPEQQKIAKILTSVDEVIEKTQAQIDKLKDLKTGMMQELLTQGVGIDGKPHTEFKDSPVGRIPKAWDVVTLRQILKVMESGWSPQCGSESAAFGEWGVLKTTAVTWNGFNYLANKKLPDSLSPKPEIVVNKGDILVTRAGPADRVGVVVYVEFVPEHIMLSDKIIRLRAGDKVRADFLSLWLSGIFAQRYLASRVSGLATSQTNISQLILGAVPCVLPSIEEQRLIAGSIMSIQARLDCLIANLEAKKQLKKALMRDLLTGKVRVNID